MKSELAEELLTQLMHWGRGDLGDKGRQLEAMATYKYDDYGNFRPGVRFFESLASWLDQIESLVDRLVALEFVMERLVFISDAEMTHLIERVYPDHIDLVLRDRAAELTGISKFAISRIIKDPVFAGLRRRSLILGASDGARLDRLRRSAPFLSHEQFLQGSEPPVDLVRPMCVKLDGALKKMSITAPPTFSHIFLIEDFSGSGETMLRVEEGKAKGKLIKLNRSLNELIEEGLVDSAVKVTVVIYVATEQALDHLMTTVCECELSNTTVRVVQTLPLNLKVDQTDPAFAELAERLYDEILTDEHKGRSPLGYADCALPLVLSHNTPNNSVSLLWADTIDEPDGQARRALFPRFERHHRDRP